MSRRLVLSWPILAALGLLPAACGSAPPPAPPAPKADVTDGFYRGTSTRFQANTRACPRPGLVMVQMWDRRFQYRWAYGVMIDAVVQQDGTIVGEGNGVSLLGKYTPDRIEGDITNGDCGLHVTLTLRDR